ncbi:MAG: glycerol-3-phosphate acyltransferase, partial [Coriobacteriales bacterium]|nr:glycerol-3-phosphate acyltransferase [Coriobacteriales bacterium]
MGIAMYYITVVLFLIVAYLLGAIPCALIVGEVTRGIDIREHGSGNTGTTNAIRVLGKKAGAVVFAGDCLKGVLASLFMVIALGVIGQHTGFMHDIPAILAVLAATLGHMFSPFMG